MTGLLQGKKEGNHLGNRHSVSLTYALKTLNKEQYRKYINAIYLYGSCARGEQNYDSDVDIFLKLSGDTPPDVVRKMKIDVIPDDYTLPHVELNYSRGDSFSVIPQFNKNIEKDGKLLWKRED